jgi:hypothetical protein
MCPDVSFIFSFFVTNSGSQRITVDTAGVTVNTRGPVSILPSETDPLSPLDQTGFDGSFPTISVCRFLGTTLTVVFDVQARAFTGETCTAQTNITYNFPPSQTEIEAGQFEKTTTLPPSIAPSPRTSTLEFTVVPSPRPTNIIPTSLPDLTVGGQPCSLKVCMNDY